MNDKVKHYSSFIKRVPAALRRLDQLIVSKDERVALGAVKIVIDKVYPDKVNPIAGMSNQIQVVTVIRNPQGQLEEANTGTQLPPR